MLSGGGSEDTSDGNENKDVAANTAVTTTTTTSGGSSWSQRQRVLFVGLCGSSDHPPRRHSRPDTTRVRPAADTPPMLAVLEVTLEVALEVTFSSMHFLSQSLRTLPTLHAHSFCASSASPFQMGVTDLKVNLKYRPQAFSSAGHALRSPLGTPSQSAFCHWSPAQMTTVHWHLRPLHLFSACPARWQRPGTGSKAWVPLSLFRTLGVCLLSGTFQTSPPALVSGTYTRARGSLPSLAHTGARDSTPPEP